MLPLPDPDRRDFLESTDAAGVAVTLPLEAYSAPPESPQANTGPGRPITIKLTINGAEHDLTLEPRVTLLDALREGLHLTGSKKGCDHGQWCVYGAD